MANEKEGLEKKFTRREFVKGSLALGASALLASCRSEKNLIAIDPTAEPTTEPSKTPTLAKTPTETATALPTPEPTPLEEINHLPGIVIDKEFLQNAFAGIGGEQVIEGESEYQKLNVISFGERYVSQAWGEEIDFTTLAENPIASLKYLISMGSYKGEEGLFVPGNQGETVIFPQLKGLTLPRLTLDVVTPLNDQEYKEWVTPQNFIYYPGTQMTIVGLMDKGASEGELDYALVAFTDYLRSSKDGVPRHYLAKIPTFFPADPDNQNAFSLANLLKANDYGYDPKSKEITFIDKKTNKESLLELNKIQGEELLWGIDQTAGIYFVDQIKEKLINNPIVPYPAEMPATWDINEAKDEEGNVSLILRGQNQTGELQDFARASYDQREESWSWERIFSPEELLAQAPQVEGLRAVWQEDRIIYQAEAGNPYNLESGEYAGYLFDIDDETGISSGQGLALAGEVRKKLLEQANTPEAIEQGEWRMTFNFDPQGERIRVWNVGSPVNSIVVSGLPSETEFKSPFIEKVLAKLYLHNGFENVGVFIPESLLRDSQKGNNNAISFYHKSAEILKADNTGRTIGFDELLFAGIGGEYLPSPFPAQSQVVIAGGSLVGAFDLPLNRILMVGKSPVFSLDKE